MIDLRSDTVTQPTIEMKSYALSASIGDDAYGEDPSVIQLQDSCKELFAKEAALFVTSGMLANRLAILTQTTRGNEVITGYEYHINFFDSAAAATICQVVLNTRQTNQGILNVQEIDHAIHSKPRYQTFAQPQLISIENTINGCAGKIFPFDEIKSIRKYTKEHQLAMHIDGARLFNAHIATGISLADYASQCDSLSICFSKGLCAPFGSMLLGSKGMIEEAKRWKGWLGSGVHQIGIYASAAYYALKNNIPLLKIDHELALLFAEGIQKIEGFDLEKTVETNMVQFSIKKLKISNDEFYKRCQSKGLLIFSWLPGIIRVVIHRPLNQQDIQKAIKILKEVHDEFSY